VKHVLWSLALTLMPSTAAAQPLPAKPSATATPTAPPCPRFGAKPPGCIEPPLVDSISIWGAWEPDGANSPEIIRTPAMVRSGTEALPLGGFPKALRSGDAGGTATVTLRLRIGADGAVEDCRASKIEMWLVNPGAKRIDLAPDPALGPLACELTRAHRRFRPALDPQGRTVPAEAEAMVRFMRQRGSELFAPAPPPPSRWLGTGPGRGAVMWPPSHWIGEQVAISAPRFDSRLAEASDLPRQAVVGASIDYAADGSAANCTVKASSGDARLDTATCAAMMETRNLRPSAWRVLFYPVEVTWNGARAALRLPQTAVLPALAEPIAIAPDLVPQGPAAQSPMRVTITLDPQGRARLCRVAGTSGDDATDAAACRIAMAQGRFKGARDVFGRPAIGGMSLRIDWSKAQITLPPY
jgi:hypothetical protein